MSYPFGKKTIRSRNIFSKDQGDTNGQASETEASQESGDNRENQSREPSDIGDAGLENFRTDFVYCYRETETRNRDTSDIHTLSDKLGHTPESRIDGGEDSRICEEHRANSNREDITGDDGGGAPYEAANEYDVYGRLLRNSHYRELVEGSAIAPELVEANFESVDGSDLYDILYPVVPGKNGHGDKRWLNRNVRSAEYQRYFDKCQDSSGWAFYAVNPLTGERTGYARVKLDEGSPVKKSEYWKPNEQTGKLEKIENTAKYKSPKRKEEEKKGRSPIPFPAVPESIWSKCSQVTQVGINGEDHFWQWLKDGRDSNNNPIPTAIIEGEKKDLSVLSLGFPAIPISGITMWSYRDDDGNRILHPDLELFATKGREITLIFDSDIKPETRFNVERERVALAYEFIKRGCKVKIAEVPLLDGKKGAIDDYIASGGNGLELIGNAIDFDVYQAKKLKQLTRKPDLLLNPPQRHLDFNLPIDKKIVAVKSPKGTGKTELLVRELKPRIDAGLARVLVIGHRTKLLLQTAKRLDIKYVDYATLEDQKKRGMVLCFDSLVSGGKGQIHIEDWKDAIIILDEADQSAIHALMSSTCTRRRPEILENLEAILKVCKQVIMLSADINDAVIEWIESMIGGEEKAYIIVNEYQDEKFNFPAIIYDQTTPDLWFGQMMKSIAKGNNLFIPVSAQREDSMYSSTAIENKIRADYPGIKLLRMDSVTTSDPLHPANQAIENSEVIKGYQVTLATPVIETGFNIPFEHFDEVWGLGRGLISSNSFRQSITRVRPNVPRHLWIADKAMNDAKIGSGSISYKQLIEGEHKKDKAIRAALLISKVIEKDDDFDCVVPEYHLKAWAKLAVPINAEISCYRQSVIAGLKDEGHTIYKWEDWVKSEILLVEKSEKLSDNTPIVSTKEIVSTLSKIDTEVETISDKEGFDTAFKTEIQTIEKQKVSTRKALKVNRDEVKSSASEKILSSEDIVDTDAEKIKISSLKTEDQVLSLKKFTTKKSFGVEPTLELIERSWNRRYYPQLRLHYAITKGREFVIENQRYKVDNIFNSNNGRRFIPDSNKALSAMPKLLYFDFLDFEELLESEGIHENHPLVQRIWLKAQKYSEDIKSFLGVSVGKSPMQFVQNLIGLIGYKFPCLGKKTIGDKRIRVYGRPAFDFEKDEKGKIKIINDCAVPVSDDREKSFEAWYQQDIERREKKLGLAENEQAEIEKLKSEMENAIAVQPEEEVLLDEDEEHAHHVGSVLVSSYEKLRAGCLNSEGFKSIVSEMIHDFRLYGGILQKLARNIFERSTVLFNQIKAITPELDQALMA
ncbi:MAG: plasmid replication protein, CyRepA1 family [Dolichospermum sp.]